MVPIPILRLQLTSFFPKTVVVFTHVFEQLHPLFVRLQPLLHVVRWLLILQPLQHDHVFMFDFLSLAATHVFLQQRFVNFG